MAPRWMDGLPDIVWSLLVMLFAWLLVALATTPLVVVYLIAG